MVIPVRQTLRQIRWLRRLVENHLQEPCAAFDLSWTLATVLEKAAPRPQVLGLDGGLADRHWETGCTGHSVTSGMSVYRLRIAERTVPVVLLTYPIQSPMGERTESKYFCRSRDLQALYRFLRRQASHEREAPPPVMKESLRQRLWDNTIGFLSKGKDAWKHYQVSLRRGVMLVGEPGNGKTMAARWLREEATANNLVWTTVTGEQYDNARNNGTLNELLTLSEPGLVFLDDFDRGLEDRQYGVTRDHSALLAALDGMEAPQGVVYVFTSNLNPADLDPAIRRPGRIDLFIPFNRPDAELRWTFLQKHWPEPIRDSLPWPHVVTQTEGLSFAELDELKKLMVLRYVDTAVWDWDAAWKEFQERTGSSVVRGPIGFASAVPDRFLASPPMTTTKLSVNAEPR